MLCALEAEELNQTDQVFFKILFISTRRSHDSLLPCTSFYVHPPLFPPPPPLLPLLYQSSCRSIFRKNLSLVEKSYKFEHTVTLPRLPGLPGVYCEYDHAHAYAKSSTSEFSDYIYILRYRNYLTYLYLYLK